MKKSIFICAACIAMTSFTVAQNKEEQQENSSFAQMADPSAPPAPPPPPPPPPAPPAPPFAPADRIIENQPVPPIPAVPPVAPIDLPKTVRDKLQPVVINSIGYDVSVLLIKGQEIVFVKNNGTTKKIRMATWLADRKHFEKKYGLLPPPIKQG